MRAGDEPAGRATALRWLGIGSPVRRCAILGVAFSVACTPQGGYVPQLPAEFHTERLGLVMGPVALPGGAAELPRPATPAEAAGRTAGQAAAATAGGGAAAGGYVAASGVGMAAAGGPVGMLVGGMVMVAGLGIMAAGVVLAPVAALVGAAAGAARGSEEAEAERRLQALETALATWSPGEEILAGLTANASAVDWVLCEQVQSCGAADGTAAPVVLVIRPELPRLEAEGRVDPDLTLHATVSAEIRRPADDLVLQRRSWSYQGETTAFTKMSDDDAALLRGQLQEATTRVAQVIRREFLDGGGSAATRGPH